LGWAAGFSPAGSSLTDLGCSGLGSSSCAGAGEGISSRPASNASPIHWNFGISVHSLCCVVRGDCPCSLTAVRGNGSAPDAARDRTFVKNCNSGEILSQAGPCFNRPVPQARDRVKMNRAKKKGRPRRPSLDARCRQSIQRTQASGGASARRFF
jgi:hypothetical protein